MAIGEQVRAHAEDERQEVGIVFLGEVEKEGEGGFGMKRMRGLNRFFAIPPADEELL